MPAMQALALVLSQEGKGVEYIVADASRALTKQERKPPLTRSMVTFTKYLKHYLWGKEFILYNYLRWLHNCYVTG